MSSSRPATGLTGFYVHLVAATCVQLAAVVVALARHAVPLWCATVLVAGVLSLAAHGVAVIAPRLGRTP